MNRAAQIYDFVLTPGGSANLAVAGGYYRIMSATGPVRVRREGGSQLGPLYPGQGERQEFNRLTVTDMSGAANTGYILVSDESFVDERITGEVSVIDGGKARSMTGLDYLESVGVGGVAGQYTHHQLFNPGTSQRRVILTGLTVSAVAPQLVYATMWHAAIANLVGASSFFSKWSNGFFHAAERRFENNAAAIGNGPQLAFYLTANGNFTYIFSRPVVLEPGKGYIVRSNTLNTDLQTGFDHYEESI